MKSVFFLVLFFEFVWFLDLQATMEVNSDTDFNSSIGIQTEPVCGTIDLYIQRTSNSHR